MARLKSKIDATAPDVSEAQTPDGDAQQRHCTLKRRIIEDLRPSSLSNLGLTAALEILTREYAERAGIDVETSLEPVQLPDAAQLTVYRMVQEALTTSANTPRPARYWCRCTATPRMWRCRCATTVWGLTPAACVPLRMAWLACATGSRRRAGASRSLRAQVTTLLVGCFAAAAQCLGYTPRRRCDTHEAQACGFSIPFFPSRRDARQKPATAITGTGAAPGPQHRAARRSHRHLPVRSVLHHPTAPPTRGAPPPAFRAAGNTS